MGPAATKEELANILCGLAQQQPPKNVGTTTSSSSTCPASPQQAKTGDDIKPSVAPTSSLPPPESGTTDTTSAPVLLSQQEPIPAAAAAAASTVPCGPSASRPTFPSLAAIPLPNLAAYRNMGLSTSSSTQEGTALPVSSSTGRNNIPVTVTAAAETKAFAENQAAFDDAITPTATTVAGAAPSFPHKLYDMMQDASTNNFDDVVSWQAGGGTPSCSFKVHNVEKFVSHVMPLYFRQTKFKSFQRQLNIYGFSRIHDGPCRGGYYHKNFHQGKPELLKLIPRKGSLQPSSTTAASYTAATAIATMTAAAPPSPANPASVATLLQAVAQGDASDFSKEQLLHLLETLPPSTLATAASMLSGAAAASGGNIAPPATIAAPPVLNILPAPPAPVAPASEPPPNNAAPAAVVERTVAAGPLSKPSGHYQYLCRETNSKASTASALLETFDQKNPHVFPWKLYKMLEDASNPTDGGESFSYIVSWTDSGRSFKVHNATQFVEKVMPRYFDQSKYESFRRQLNLYGFQRVIKPNHRSEYRHPLFVRGKREQCRLITRDAKPKPPPSNISHNKTGGAFPLPPILGKGV